MSSNNKRSNRNGGNGDANPNEPRAKKANTTPSLADDLICPITQELPIDPVNAEDGQHYEREAIETHIKNNPGDRLKSPITNDAMGPRLVAAHRIKNLIETSVATGGIVGELADNWKQKMKQKRENEELQKKAESGDENAMFTLGFRYNRGSGGLKKDIRQAYEWFRKAHEKGSNNAAAGLGILLVSNSGLPENKVDGLMYLMYAAARGSNLAAYGLGLGFAAGAYGLSVNKQKAIYWLEKSLVLTGTLSEVGRNQVEEELAELKANASDSE